MQNDIYMTGTTHCTSVKSTTISTVVNAGNGLMTSERPRRCLRVEHYLQVNHICDIEDAELSTLLSGCRACYHKDMTVQSECLYHQLRLLLLLLTTAICRILTNTICVVLVLH